MGTKAASRVVLALLMAGMLTLAFDIQPSRANGTIYIKADGSIEGTTQIVTSDEVTYVFTADIVGYIVVERSNIVIDGQGHTVEGMGGDAAQISLNNVNNVTIEGANIKGFNREWGITFSLSSNCSIHENNITNNYWGIYLYCSSNNRIYHNNFIGNTEQVHSVDSMNIWDDGYPYGGNYWSNYVDVDVHSGPDQDESGNDGIWDHPYVVNFYNEDRYPLVNPWVPRTVGVEASDWVKYSVEIVGYRPGFPVDLNEVEWGKTIVRGVSGTIIEADLLWHLKNGTEITTTGTADVVTSGYPGPTIMTGLFVSKDLPAGATLYATYPFGPIPPSLEINETVFREYSGVSRETNHIDATEYGIHIDEYWDKATGVLSEFNEEYRTYWSVHFEIVDTNLWEAPTPPTIVASLDIDPDALNLRSRDKWITAYIQLPEGYNPADINASTILLNGTNSPIMDPKYDFVTNSSEYLVDYNNDGLIERMVKFDKVTVESFINSQGISDGNVALTVSGKLLDGTIFEGTDIIRVSYGGPSGRRR